MAMCHRPFDVTTAPSDVSKRVMNAVWCDQTCKSRKSIASALLYTLERSSFAQCKSTSTIKRLSSSVATKQGRGRVPTRSKKK